MKGPAAFVGPRTEPARVLYRPTLPLCVATAVGRGESEYHAQFWHDTHERESLGGCQRCAFLAAAPHRQPAGEAIDSGTYADEAGRALVARGVWDADQIRTESEAAEQTARGMRGKR